MSIAFNDNIDHRHNKFADSRQGGTTPYPSVAVALANLPLWKRHKGLEICIDIEGVATWHIFKEGIADVNLVVREGGSAGIEDIYTTPHPQFPIDYLIKEQGGTPTTVTQLPRPDGIIFSGGVTWLTGLTVLVGVHAYYINGEFYTSPETQLTFAEAHPTLPRIDIIAVNTAGEAEIVQGTPDANPQRPDLDPATQREVTFKLIAAAQTDLGDGMLVIYNENTEFTGSANFVGAAFDATVQPYDGTYHIDVQNIGGENHLTLTDTVTHHFIDYINLTFFIWLKAAMNNQESLYVYFLKAGVRVSTVHLVPLDKSLAGQYQLININVNNLSYRDADFDAIRFEWFKQGAQTTHVGFYMDLIRMEAEFVPPVITTDHNLLSNLQGGTADERYHLNKAKHDTVQKIGEAENLPTWNGAAWPGGGGGGSATPEYNPIDVVEYYEDGKVKQVKTDIGSTKFIDKRVAYHDSGDNIGKADFAEIKDESTEPALWKKIQYNYTEKVLTSTTVTDIVAWTIII